MKYTGVNIAGFDFSCNIDGNCHSDGAYPPLLQYYGHDGEGQMNHFIKDDGFNTFRLPVSWQFLVNDVLLRRNPHDVQEWEKRVALHGDDDEKVPSDHCYRFPSR